MKMTYSNKIIIWIKHITLFFILGVFTVSCNDFEKTISVDDLTKGSWYLENSNLKSNLDNYMESRGVNEHIYRELQFIGYDENKSGKVVFFENINNVEACKSEGSYFAKRDESGVLHVTISGLSNSNGYCTYVNKLNGKYDYKYMLASDVDEKYSNTYKDVKWFILSKDGREVIFQKSNK
jgi:hypothetical protein